MVSFSKILLPLFLLALQPMEIPSLMRESFIHPSFQAFSFDNETTTDLPSPVDFFVGTVEKKMEPVVVPLSPSDICVWDIIIPSITSFLKEAKLAVSVAAEDFYWEISDAKIVFVNDKIQTLINNFWADVLVATAPFRFGTEELLDEMASSFVQFLELLSKRITSWKEESATAAKDFYQEMSAKFELFGQKTHGWINKCMSDALIASAPFRLAATDLFDQIAMSVTTNSEEFSSKFQTVAQDVSNALDSNCQELYQTFETVRLAVSATAAKNFYNEIMSVKFKLYKTSEIVTAAFSGFDVYLPLVMQAAMATMTAAILVCFLVFITTVTILGCKVLSQAFAQNILVHETTDDNDKIFESNLFTFDYDDDGESNLVPFDPSSIAVLISLTFSVDEGRINLSAPSIVIESSASTRVADDSLVNAPAAKVTPAAEKTKKENDQEFTGPSFVEYRDPQPEFDDDDDDDDDDDESSVASAVSVESDEPEEPDATVSTHRHPGRLLFDFFDRREPHIDFDDDDDEEEESTVATATADDFDASMEDLLFSFSKMSFEDKTPPKTVSDSEMDDLVNALANF